jgi:UDP-N-acetyl-D-glucosamine/UDP-N-acetyl-D-galactosamine dehydrogenase
MTLSLENLKIAVVGLGYVGMPLAVALAKYGPVIGYDINKTRVNELNEGWDSNREIRQNILRATSCSFTHDLKDIEDCNVYIVTVPTPIDDNNDPDLTVVERATEALGEIVKKGDIICYESTVYPGVTEDICGPILEKASGLKSGIDFFLGYSPERINPGDEVHTVENITKVVAGQTEEVADLLVALYGQMNGGRIFKAKDIKTAEASKAIENAQRDINIAFINEITMLLNKHGLNSHDVLEAAGTKWNFLPFRPGLVGGHCIGVDPYYLAKCAIDIGHQPEVILAGRKTNDGMGAYIAEQIDGFLDKKASKILLLGFTFKENINDIRNTKVIDVVHNLKKHGHTVDVHDPHAMAEDVKAHYDLDLLEAMPKKGEYDCIALMVPHSIYTSMNVNTLSSLLNKNSGGTPLIYDMKHIWKEHKFPETIQYKYL